MSLSSRTIAPRESQVAEAVISCPNCQHEIKLTESLAAPLLKNKELEFKQREAELREREAGIELALTERLAVERKKLAEDEHKKARLAIGAELEMKQRELSELGAILKIRNAKLAEAQAAQAELVRKQRELDDQKREIELTIEKRVSASVNEIKAKARHEAADEMKLKVMEKDQVIQSMQRQIEELRRKSEQGSQQL